MTSEAMIEFSHVCKRYATGKNALNDVSFELYPGEMVFLTGHSGAGKSTLLKLIMHMEVATTGQVMVAGRNLNRMSKRRVPYHRRQIGNLDPALSAEIMRLFEQFTELGMTTLIASHDHALIKRLDNRVLALNEGSLVYNDFLPERSEA